MHGSIDVLSGQPTSAPLILNTLAHSVRQDIADASAEAGAVRRDCGPDADRATRAAQALREAMADPRSAGERTIDAIVDRLLHELTW